MQLITTDDQGAFTLMELVVSLSLLSILFVFAVANLPQMVNPAQSGAGELSAFMTRD
jgi:prepilin-type N-terminal cleavage/methylation domain-containing protein